MTDDPKAHTPRIDPPPVGWDAAVSAPDPAENRAASLMTDEFLLRAYQRTTGEPGDPEADALLAEIERRGLDV